MGNGAGASVAPSAAALGGGAVGDGAEAAPDKWSFQRDGFCLTADIDRPFVLEIFAGSGRLTRALRARGLDAWAVDWRGGRLQRETPAFFLMDATDPKEQKVIMKLLTHPLLLYVHFAPPGGTCSRAREIRLPGVPGGGPQPLRSELHPLGLPDLQELCA